MIDLDHALATLERLRERDARGTLAEQWERAHQLTSRAQPQPPKALEPSSTAPTARKRVPAPTMNALTAEPRARGVATQQARALGRDDRTARALLRLAREKGRLTATDAALALGCSYGGGRNALRRLADAGALVMIPNPPPTPTYFQLALEHATD